MQEASIRIALRDGKENVKNQSGFVLHHGFQTPRDKRKSDS